VHVLNPEIRGIRPSVTISYSVPKRGPANLVPDEWAEPEQPRAQPTEAWSQVDGGFTVGTDQTRGYLRCKVLLEREGTQIRIESTAMAEHEVIALARSLVPLGPEPCRRTLSTGAGPSERASAGSSCPAPALPKDVNAVVIMQPPRDVEPARGAVVTRCSRTLGVAEAPTQ
jgi:hypothetical protein